MKPYSPVSQLLAATAFLVMAACSPEPPASENLRIVLGKSAGPITAGTTREQLVKIYGADNVADTEFPIGEGETVPATVVFPGTAREATVIWSPGNNSKKVDRVVITGDEWSLPEGIRHGDALEAVEEINGGPFMIYGFGWDYGGVGYFKGGQLDRKVQIWFRPGMEEGPDYEKVLGDSLFNSADPHMRAVNPRIAEVAVVLHGTHD